MRNLTWTMLQAFVMMFVAGCSNSDLLSSQAANRLKALSTIYLDYAVARGSGPADEQQLCAHARNVPGFLLKAGGVKPDALNAALISERDGEKFIFRYGIGISQAENGKAPLIAYEKNGKDGTRLVAFANGNVDCLNEDAAKELMHEIR